MIYKDNRFGYVDNGEETPGNIPNPAVKLSRGENSARATWCQNSKMYLLLKNPSGNTGVFFCLNSRQLSEASLGLKGVISFVFSPKGLNGRKNP